jgi:hypothetical protein
MLQTQKQRWFAGLILVAAAPIFTACSQVASLTPVAGDAIAEVSIATNDVLIENDVAIKIVPVCEGTKPDFVCTGETIAGDKIESKTWGDDAENLSVVVAGKQIYSGEVEAVITKAGSTS